MSGQPTDIQRAMQTRQAIMNYLTCGQPLRSVLAAIQSADDLEAARRFVCDLEGYGDPQRRASLRRHLDAVAA